MLFLLLSNLPTAQAASPAARWGHQAMYVDSAQAMYVVGGEVASGAITNEVIVLPVSPSRRVVAVASHI